MAPLELTEMMPGLREDACRPCLSPHLSKRSTRSMPVTLVTNVIWAAALVAYTWAVAARARLSVSPCDCERQVEPLPTLPSRTEIIASACHDPIRWALYVENATLDRKVHPLVKPGARLGQAQMNSTRANSTLTTPTPKAHNYVIRPVRPLLPLNEKFKFYGWSGNHSEDPPDREAYVSFFVDDKSTKKYGGTFVEVGAGDGWHHSNTLFFEESLGWIGVLIEADEESGKKLLSSKFRRAESTKKVIAAMCDPKLEGKEVRYAGVGSNSGVEAYMSQEYVRIHEKDWRQRARKVKCKTLHSVLERAGVGAVDLMTVDVAGAEKQVLQGANFEKVHVRVLVVAMANEQGSTEKAMREFLMEKGFCFARRIGKNEFWVGDEVMKRMHCAWAGLRVEP